MYVHALQIITIICGSASPHILSHNPRPLYDVCDPGSAFLALLHIPPSCASDPVWPKY